MNKTELWNYLEKTEDKEILNNAIMSIVYLVKDREFDYKKTIKHIKNITKNLLFR